MSDPLNKPEPPEGPIVSLVNVSFTLRHGYDAGLDDVNLELGRGDLAVVLLEEGCVEHPLPDIVSGLQESDSGIVRVFGQEWEGMGPDRQALMRWHIGRVFSGHGWLSNLDVDENVTLSERHHSSRSHREIDEEAAELSRLVGLERVPHERPSVVENIPLRKAEWVRAALGSPWLILLEVPGRDMPAGWIRDLLPLIERARAQGAAVIWLCEDEREWGHQALNPSLKLRAIGNKLSDEGPS